ncbi:hypothetical protein ACFYUV_37995 [Nonomuraea sp. NPDC003560]|uniref:hypothetical protein n=1 Tax=Nonomuraea sp. NPDC003560 TaxID=3364341 RepID=UPI00369049C4
MTRPDRLHHLAHTATARRPCSLTQRAPAEVDDMEMLASRYPYWLIRRSGTGRFWANTWEPVLRPGWDAILGADTLDELEGLLERQERLRGRRPQ